jgi:hypothetical protein
MTDRVWVRSNGGPLLLLPIAQRPMWHGTDAGVAQSLGDADRPLSDYDRACAVADYTGVIRVGGAEALVLGDEPNDTTWIPLGRGGILVRWVYAEGDEQAAAALASIPPDIDWEPAGTFAVAASPLELFDSAESGAEPLGERLHIALAPGDYKIARANYRPDAETWLQLVRLQSPAT